MMNRIERLRAYIDEIMLHMRDHEERRGLYVHLYSVSMACALIAARRGEDVELATLAGMLHDLYTYKTLISKDHAYHGSILASDVLGQLGLVTEEEKETICSAIRNHSDKGSVHSGFDEVLKDADVLHHCLHDPTHSVMAHEKPRWENLKSELALRVDI